MNSNKIIFYYKYLLIILLVFFNVNCVNSQCKPYLYEISYKDKFIKKQQYPLKFEFEFTKHRWCTEDRLWIITPEIKYQKNKKTLIWINTRKPTFGINFDRDREGNINFSTKDGDGNDRQLAFFVMQLLDPAGKEIFKKENDKITLEYKCREIDDSKNKIKGKFNTKSFSGAFKSNDDIYDLSNFKWIESPQIRKKNARCILQAQASYYPPSSPNAEIEKKKWNVFPNTTLTPIIMPHPSPSNKKMEQEKKANLTPDSILDPINLDKTTLIVISKGFHKIHNKWYAIALDIMLKLVDSNKDKKYTKIAIATSTDKLEILLYPVLPGYSGDQEKIDKAKKLAGSQLNTTKQQGTFKMIQELPRIIQNNNLEKPNVIIILPTEWSFFPEYKTEERYKDFIKPLKKDINHLSIVYLSKNKDDTNEEFDKYVISNLKKIGGKLKPLFLANKPESNMETELKKIFDSIF